MYSFSTCWNTERHQDGRTMLLEVRQLGFEYAELSHGTRISQLPGIYEAVNAREIKISSVHNFCPLPLGIEAPSPNCVRVLRCPRIQTPGCYKKHHFHDRICRKSRGKICGSALGIAPNLRFHF